VEGRRAVRELLVAGTRRVHDVWLSAEGGSAGIVDEITELAVSSGVPVRRVDAEQLARKARTESPQGVVAFAAALVPVELDEVLATPGCFAVALDGVTDPQNPSARCLVSRGARRHGRGAAAPPRSASRRR
jgi:23S rRNA (guanosine2251-2'-O)-methyltransferase